MKKYLRHSLCSVSAFRGNFVATLLRLQLDVKKYLLAGSLLVALNVTIQTRASGLLMRVEQPYTGHLPLRRPYNLGDYTADKLSSSSKNAINSLECAKLLGGRKRSLKLVCILAASARIAALPNRYIRVSIIQFRWSNGLIINNNMINLQEIPHDRRH